MLFRGEGRLVLYSHIHAKRLAILNAMATTLRHGGPIPNIQSCGVAPFSATRAAGEKRKPPMNVRLDGALARRTLVLALLLLWPLILFGRPSYISDSASYLKGGRVAVEFVTAKLFPGAPQAPAPVAGPSAAKAPNSPVAPSFHEAPKGARSVTYSVAAYLLRWPGIDMTALALVQIVCAAFIAAVTLGVLGVTGWGRFLAVGAVLAFATPLALSCAYAIPDVFSGFVIATLILMSLFLDRMSVGVRLVTAALTIFSVTAHASVPPLAMGMVIVGGAILLIGRRFGLARPRWAWAWLIVPPALGLIANTAIGFVAFGEVSVAAKRFPTALTRSVVDGPARWYLEKHCATEHYAVCEVFGTHIPSTINDFLFYKWGLNGRATPEQMDRIRAEEAEIVMKAALEYPGYEAYNLSRNILRQLFRYDLGKSRFKERLALDAEGTPQLVLSGRQMQPVMVMVGMLNNIVLVLCIGWVALNLKRLDNRERFTTLLVVAGLVGNATIVVAFSSLASRYQARVIWVLPLFLLGMAAAHYRNKSAKARQPETGKGEAAG